MQQKVNRFVVAPVDGSRLSLRSLDYVQRVWGGVSDFKIDLVHILPALPPVMVDEAKRNRNTAKQLKMIDRKNLELGHRILQEARDYLVKKGFAAEAVESLCEKKRSGTARDINACAEDRLADALIVSSSGKGWLEGFFMGEVTNKLVEIVRVCPIWVVKGDVRHGDVMLAVDGSENSMRAVDHASWMLYGTGSRIVLFHARRSLNRFFPKEVFEGIQGIEDTWSRGADMTVEAVMTKARGRLIRAGIDPDRIETIIVDGGRRPDKIILQQAVASKAGTVVLGRRGESDVGGYTMGSVTRKVLNEADNLAVWIVS